MFWWQIHIIDKCTMKFAPFYNTEYDIGQPGNDFGNSQSPGSLLSPSVPPFPTSWETLQVVCCPIWLSSKYNVLFNSALPLLCSEPIMKIRQSNSEIFWNRATLVGVFAPFHFSNERGGGRGGMEQKNTAIPCVILQETAARLLFMAVSFHIFILFPFL